MRCTAGQLLCLPCEEVLPQPWLISGLPFELFVKSQLEPWAFLPTDTMYSSCSINWPCLGQSRDIVSFQVEDSGHSFPGGGRAAVWPEASFHRVSLDVFGSGSLEVLLPMGVTIVTSARTLRRMRPYL